MNIIQKNYLKKVIFLFTAFGAILYFSHFSPSIAIRSHVFMLGYPKSALTSEIVEYEESNELNKEEFDDRDMKMYTISKPPIDRDTETVLSYFLVKKVGIFYFAEYAGGL